MTDRDRAAVSGIVLAGGGSTRFGRDKLRASVDGSPLLERAIRGVAAVATDVVVVVALGDRRAVPSGGVAIRTVHDHEADGGPLVGLVAGLEAVAEPLAIVVAGDMPDLRATVLELLIRTLVHADDGIAAIALESRGRLEPLPVAVRTGVASSSAARLVADGERSLRGLFERLPTRMIEEGAWRPLDPESATLRDIDTPSDLEGRA